ncbi:hypothetical protein MSTO_20660 [Mycobacterium stomatepiae]|uniref:Hydrogenase maturation factor HypA n=1 Tax=Mycobacterium stomatepiae TaxID=470076 RepID=A0A7I7Q6V7_9MYCO|nr:hypothetical protein MSTO_20660 [Mycobacterium stomatepiae]
MPSGLAAWAVTLRLDRTQCADNHNFAHKICVFPQLIFATALSLARQHGVLHELSLCQAIAGLVKPHAAGRRVDVVRVQVGALRQVVPDSLEFCWSLVCQQLEENMVDAQLELDLVPAEVLCHDCEQQSRIESRWSVYCPGCASTDVDVLSGNEFLVTSIEVS